MIKKCTFFIISCLVVASNLFAQQVGSGFTSITNLSPEPTSTTTGEKPQSKPWQYDGKWWAVFPNSGGTFLWRLDGTNWTNVLKLSSRTTSKADCKVAGNLTHVLLYQGSSSQMASVEYDSALGTYKLWSRRTSTVGLTLDKGVETATIDIDSRGRMWLASAGVSDINVRWSDPPYSNWNAPITIASGVTDDDICAVKALPGKIGVFWSNQSTKRFGFKTHNDGADPAVWASDEVPASQSALNIGNGMADDHLNMSVSGDGTLYCAIKTEYGTRGYPQIALLVRRPSGSWDNLYGVSEIGTRPIVILNEQLDRIKVIYTSGDSGGDILYKESAASNISFGSQLTLLKGSYNNPTSSKDNYTSDIVVLASSSTHVVGVLATDGTTSPSQYTLAVSSSSGGTVAKSPDQASYAPGSPVTLTASPQAGFQFAGWSGDASGTANPLTLTMDRSRSVTASFTAAPSTQPQVVSFTLVNASNEQDLFTVQDGATINLASLPTSRLNMRANTSPGAVGSVKLELSGTQSRTYTDNAAPYALQGDDGAGNYYYGAWGPPPAGTYTLRATPYSGSKASGTAGTPLTITFNVVSSGFAGSSSSALQGVGLQQDELSVYPNPFSNKATLRFSLQQESDYSVTLFDARGARVSTLNQGKSTIGEINSVEIDGTVLPRGLYFIKLQTNDASRSLKLILDK